MTGPDRGETAWATEAVTDIRLARGKHLSLGAEPAAATVVARLTHVDGGYAIEPVGEAKLFVNGAPATPERRRLAHRDVIEFGDDGPISRISFYRQGARPQHTAAEVLRDAVAYLRVSRQPWRRRLGRVAKTMIRRFAMETSLPFRAVIVAALAALVYFAYQAAEERGRLAEQVASGAQQLDAFGAALARANADALRPADLTALRDEFARGLTRAAGRLDELEARTEASRRVIARSAAAVAFLQGAYGFREDASGRVLRHAVDAGGQILRAPGGQPLLTLEGDGPVAERQMTGTGFVVARAAAAAVIVTNRHVALPWEEDASAEALAARGLTPIMLKLIAYFPDATTATPLRLLRAGENSDLAVLAPEGEAAALPPPLPLAEEAPAPGTEIIVMGYPTGLRALLAQTGPAFVEALQQEGAFDFWLVAERLAAAGFVHPLASRGIVAQATAATIVYDAETTHGGSGGPVLDASGRVIAVNAAILPEYGGSNLGVPVIRLRALLAGPKRN